MADVKDLDFESVDLGQFDYIEKSKSRDGTLNFESVDLGQFDVVDQKKTRLNATMSQAVIQNPTQTAKVRDLSRRSGIPAQAVESDIPSVETHLKLKNINLDDMVRTHPVTSDYLSQYDNAAVAHDDIDTLKNLESLMNPPATVQPDGNLFTNLGESIGLSVQGMYEGLKLRIADNQKTRRSSLQASVGRGAPLNENVSKFQEFFGLMSQAQRERELDTYIADRLSTIQGIKDAQQAITPSNLNILEKGVRAGLESLVMNLPAFITMAVTKGQGIAPSMGVMATQSYTTSYGDARASGLSEKEADYKASIDAAIEVVTEVLPFKTLEKIVTGKSTGLTKDALVFAVREMGTEQLATLGQSFNDYIFGLDEQMDAANGAAEVLAIQLERQAVTAIATIVAGGAQTAIATGFGRKLDAAQKEEMRLHLKGIQEQKSIDGINEYSANSELRKIDPDSFRQFIDQSDGDKDLSIFIDGVQAKLYVAQLPESNDPVVQMLNAKVSEAAALGSDVAIPIADFATMMAGTEHYDALREFMTLSGETTAPFRQEQRTTEFDNYIQSLMAEAEENTSSYVEAQDIYNSVREQLIDTGIVSGQNAAVMAQLVPAWATVFAQRNGITIKEAYEQSGLLIQGPQTGEAARLAAEAEQLTQMEGFDNVDAQSFRDLATTALTNNPNGGAATIHTAEEYAGMDLYTTDEGRAGFAIENGMLVSVFKDPSSTLKGAMGTLVPAAIKAGANRLEAFDGFLTEQYAKYGFEEIDRIPWDDNFAPSGWDTATQGTPDVVVMKLKENDNAIQQTTKTPENALQQSGGVRGSTGVLSQQNSRNAEREADGSLQGLPRQVGQFTASAWSPAQEVARKYAEKSGIPYNPPATYAEVDVNRARRIADAFEQGKHDPQNPEVKAAYQAMIDETLAQYESIVESGLVVEFIDFATMGDPYDGSPRKMTEDVINNNHMYVFSTRDGFGSSELDVSDNPLLAETEFDISGQKALANDIFRVVHDYFGHVKEGVGFRASGEENAWRAHSAMYSPLARRAMTTETRGQNSWVNFGPNSEFNKTASGADTVYADQKVMLLPEWVSTEAAGDSAPAQVERFMQSTALRRKTETLKRFGLDPAKTHKTRDVAAALEARQREKFGRIDDKDYSDEASKRIAKWMLQEVEFEMENGTESGVGWYSEKFQRAIDTFATHFPELKTDKNARDTLTALIAITSDGQKVAPNFRQAIELYSAYRDTGEFTVGRKTQRQSSVDGNLQNLKSLFDEMGVEQTHAYLMETLTVGEMKALAREQGVEFNTAYKVDVSLPRAALILGPKLGAFYANLMGSNGYLTMDRWWSRSFNRYRGNLLDKVIGTEDAPTDARGNKIGLARFKEILGNPDISDDEALIASIAPRNAYADRGYKNPTDIEKAANTVYKAAFENIRDVPLNASDRSFMLATVERASKMLSRKGQPTSVADIQAILWYYEKRLYGDLGARQTADISYEDAAKTIVNELGGFTGPDFQSEVEQFAQAAEEIYNPELEQNQGVTRGYYSPSESIIRLNEAANLSTFLHEFAHFMYEMELTSAKQTPDSVNMISSIHNWYKRNADDVAKEAMTYADMPVTSDDVVMFLDSNTTGDEAKDKAIRRAVHEQFARGFETYLMEGKAPSIELRNAFRTFARWLTQVYRAVRGNLKVNLDPEMRKVFDTLLATEEQINAAEARANYAPMFTDAAMAGMTEQEFAEYKQKQDKVKDKQTETLRDKLIAEITRQSTKQWKEELTDEVDVQTEALKTERVYRAREALKEGEIKLDHAATKDLIGEDVKDKRGRESRRIPPKLNGMTIKGAQGVHPDEAAALLGYGSGDEMLADLMDAPTIKERAEAQAEAVMLERHGDILHDGTIEKQADDALLNEERGALILTELKALGKGTKAPAIDRQMLKSMAEESIGKLAYRNIHPEKYRKAEIRAAQESAAALQAGNKEGAMSAKVRQAMNFYLHKAATEARNDTMKIVERMARYNTKTVREAVQKAENGYWEQIVKILNRFEFRKSASLRGVDQRNQDINSWVKERVEIDGDALILTPEVLDELFTTHWKNVEYDKLKGINDSVKNIEHVARYANKIKTMGEEIEFKKLVNRWTTHMDAATTTRFKSQRTDVAEGRSWGRMAMAQMTKIPFLASWLDGGERGGMSHDILVQPFTDAQAEEVKLWTDVGQPVMELIQNRSKADIKRHNTKVFIRELVDENNDGNLYGNQIVAVALNTGNAGNLRKMLLGEGWANAEDESSISLDNPKLQAILRRMTKSDWDLVQTIWDRMELLYPQLSEVHRRTTGLVPPKVDATPVQTPYGEYKGGYYPVKYDPNRSQRAQDNEDKLNAQVDSMFSNSSSIQASVTASATNERTKYYAPIRLSLDVVPAHFQEAIHFITHHDAVRQANKLIRNPEVTKTIKEKLGPEEYAQLKPWLNDIAKDGREANTKLWWEDMIGRLRFGITLGSMGFKASTGIMQLLGVSNIAAEVGSKYAYQSFREILGSPANMKNAWDFASNNSKILKSRVDNMDREIKNAMSRINSQINIKSGSKVKDIFYRFDNSNVLKTVQEASMKHIAYIQTYMVDLPTWYAAYIKELEASGDEAKAYRVADTTVEMIQGSGATKDLAAIMRTRNETTRMLTMFMTFFSSLWNMNRDLVKGAKSGQYSVTTVAAKLMFLTVVPVAAEMLLRGELDSDDEDEDTRLQKFLTKTALYPVASLPFVRDIASGTVGEFGYNMSPVASLVEQGTNSIPELLRRPFTDEEITKGQVKGGSKFVAAALGIPATGQIWATGEHLYQVLEDGEELTARELLFGPKK